jgi:hypothetical protein
VGDADATRPQPLEELEALHRAALPEETDVVIELSAPMRRTSATGTPKPKKPQ